MDFHSIYILVICWQVTVRDNLERIGGTKITPRDCHPAFNPCLRLLKRPLDVQHPFTRGSEGGGKVFSIDKRAQVKAVVGVNMRCPCCERRVTWCQIRALCVICVEAGKAIEEVVGVQVYGVLPLVEEDLPHGDRWSELSEVCYSLIVVVEHVFGGDRLPFAVGEWEDVLGEVGGALGAVDCRRNVGVGVIWGR